MTTLGNISICSSLFFLSKLILNAKMVNELSFLFISIVHDILQSRLGAPRCDDGLGEV